MARVHFALADLLQLALAGGCDRTAAPRRSGWDRLALTELDDELAGSLRALPGGRWRRGPPGPKVGRHIARAGRGLGGSDRCEGLERYRALLGELQGVPEADLAMLSVAVRTLGELGRGALSR